MNIFKALKSFTGLDRFVKCWGDLNCYLQALLLLDLCNLVFTSYN